eukprot:TRINITY_DN3270_c0_g1_i7.p1 TRINITY_DN3270_c0_g1~~TRINITY_DN3270_c0_g1_i7.p1  ORF type:complete len:171 (-),score=9.26 TRINITY_DN3270_c0_g1_i7:38-550(-)
MFKIYSEQWPDFGCEGIKVQRAHQPTSQCQGKKKSKPHHKTMPKLLPLFQQNYNNEFLLVHQTLILNTTPKQILPTAYSQILNISLAKFHKYSILVKLQQVQYLIQYKVYVVIVQMYSIQYKVYVAIVQMHVQVDHVCAINEYKDVHNIQHHRYEILSKFVQVDTFCTCL